MTTLQEHFDNLTYCSFTIRKRFVGLFVREFIDPKYSTTHVEMTLLKSEFLTQFLPIYLNILEQDFNSVTKIEPLFRAFADNSNEFKTLLERVFSSTFDKLHKDEINWENELIIEPVERYLRIQDKIPFNFPTDSNFLTRDRYKNFSDAEFDSLKQEFNSLLRERDNKNLLSLGISYSYANINLPKTYDIIFDTRDTTKFWEQKTIVRFAFNYRVIFHTDLWRGHHSHCLIEIIGQIPSIFDELPDNNGGQTLHKGIGLCSRYDWQFVRKNNCA
jgi:hypothetical protein